MSLDPLEPAFQAVTGEEAAALRLAVTYALRQGLASEYVDGAATNHGMVSVGRKLGCPIPDWCVGGDE